MSSWRHFCAWIGGGISAFLVAYVAYAHVVAASHRASQGPREVLDSFAERDALGPAWTVQKRGSLTETVHSGLLTVQGGGKAGDELVIAGETRRFDDGIVTLHFRVPANDAVETFVGIEEQGGNHKRVEAGFVGGASPLVHVTGDLSGPFRSAKANDDVHVEASEGDWHTLSMQFTPVYSLVTAHLDGRPLISQWMGWAQGTDARLVFGVKLRSDVTSTRVEMKSIALDSIDWSVTRSFDESFSGDFLDVKRWMLQFPEPSLGTLDVRIGHGTHGLALDGRMHALAIDPSLVFMMRTVPFFLKSIHMKAVVWIDELEDASLFIGLMGASVWTPPDRVFDVGVNRQQGQAETYIGGNWTADGAGSFEPGEKIELPRAISLSISYDAATSLGSASIEGKSSSNHYLDLKPLDIAAFRIGALAHARTSKVKLRVQSFSVEMH